jgi:hypothetical protein
MSQYRHHQARYTNPVIRGCRDREYLPDTVKPAETTAE